MQHWKDQKTRRSSRNTRVKIFAAYGADPRLARAAGGAVAALGTVMASGLFGLSSSYGATITSTGIDTAGQTSFNTGLHWSDGNPPAPTNAYLVNQEDQIRTPTTGGNLTFGGGSLTLGDGTATGFGILTFKGNPGDTITIGNLTLNSGIIQSGGTSGGTANPWTLTTTDPVNNPIIIGSGGFAVDDGNTAARTVTIAADLTGSGALLAIDNPNAGNPAATATNSINGGTLIFTGNNIAWSGTELISGGVLQVGAGGATGSLGTGAINVDNALTFDVTANETYTQAMTVDASQTGTISNISTGTIAMAGVTVNGTLALSNSTGGLAFSGPIATSTGTLAITNGGGTIAIGGVTGGATLSVGGTGTTSLSGTNSYTGDTLVNGGTLAIIGGGTIPSSNNWTIAANATLDLSHATGSLTTTSTGTITGGGTIIGNVVSGGTLAPGAGNTIGTLAVNGNLSITGGTLATTLSGTSTSPGGATNDLIDVNGNLTLSGATDLNISFIGGTPTVGSQYEILSYTGSLLGSATNFVPVNRSISVSVGSGEVIATVTNSAPANLVWDSTSNSTWDIVTTPNWLNTGTSANDRFYQGDNVTFNDSVAGVQTNINVSAAVSPTSVTVNSTANNYTFSGAGEITGGSTFNVTLGATNSLTIAENNNYTGTTTINSGTVQIGNGGTIGSLGAGTIVNNGTLLYTRSDDPTVANVISGTGSLVINGGGATLTGASTFTGGTNIIAGTVFPDNNSALGAATSTVTVQGNGQIYTVQANTYAQPIQLNGTGPSSTGVLRGGGAVTSTFTGPVTLLSPSIINMDSGATIALTNTNALTLNGQPLEVAGSGTLAFGGNVDSSSVIFSSATIGFVPAASTTITIGSPIEDFSSPASILQNGAGTTVLSTSNSYSGSTTVENGMLLLSSNSQLGSTSSITTFGNASVGTGVIGLTGGSTFSLGGSGSLAITMEGRSGTTADDASIDNVSGNNTLTNTINSVVGGAFYAVQSDAGLLTMSGAFTPTSGTGARFLQLQGNGAGNWSGVISDGTAMITVIESSASGTGSWTLSNANTFSGGAIVASGTLNVANTSGSATGTGTVQLYGGVLASSTPTASIAGVVAAGTVTNPVIGTNTLTLTPAAATIAPGGLLNVGSLSVGGLTTDNLITLNFDLGTGGPGVITNGDLLTLGSGTVSIGSGTAITFGTDPSTIGDDYRLIGGSVGGINLSDFVLPTAPAGVGYSLSTSVDTGYIDLVVAAGGPASLSWDNLGGSGNGTTWDTVQQNWNNGTAPALYSDGANVTFNDTNNGHYAVTLNGTVSPNSVLVNNSNGNYTISGTGGIAGAGSLTKSGADTLTLSTVNTYSGGTDVTAGKLIINAAGALPASHAVSITGGVLELAANTGGETLSSLSISPNGAMDIGNNHVILSDPSGSIDATIRDYLINGYNNGNWNGTGATGGSIITSSATGTKYGIGYADGADGGISGITSGQLEVKYTLYGDANLDGSVNSIDFGDMAANFGKSGKVWDQGDFNYDGAVNSIDFGLLAGNFGKSVGSSADVVTSADWAALDAFAAANGLTAEVPEPATTSLAAVGLIGVLARRRRQRSRSK